MLCEFTVISWCGGRKYLFPYNSLIPFWSTNSNYLASSLRGAWANAKGRWMISGCMQLLFLSVTGQEEIVLPYSRR